MSRIATLSSLFIVLTLASATACRQETMTLATTTSTYDTGLLDALIPAFERENNLKVKVVAAGTGQALALGARGDADVLLVHDPEAEAAFMAKGQGSLRVPVMYNYFVLVGPKDDPAGAKGAGSAPSALARVAQARATFVSRGDNSGTHAKEKSLWSAAGLGTPQGEKWYLAAGQGMGETLTLASEKAAYTLSDLGTYLALKERLKLDILVPQDELLCNPYSVILVNPQQHPNVQTGLATKFKDYLLARETQETIARFGVQKFGQPLFFPLPIPIKDNKKG